MIITNNRKFILGIMFKSLMVYGLALMPALLLALYHGEDAVADVMFLICFVCIIMGKVLSGHFHVTFETMKVAKMRVCYMTTIVTWMMLIILSALPYYFAPPQISFLDCLFESCASWTTTGATTVAINELPHSLQLWHATCNWLGGLGIILLTLTLLPNWQFVGQNLAATELPGPGFLKLKSTFRKSYRRLLGVYVIITVLQFILLAIAGMPLLTALLTALSCASTSGMLHINNGVITQLSMSIKIIITIFTFIASINFSVLIMVMLGKFKIAFKGSEFRFHTCKVLIMTIFVTATIGLSFDLNTALAKTPEVLMQVVSFASTSAYIVSDCKYWPILAKSFIVLMVFTGACAVSTGGGLKNARVVILLKTSVYGVYKHIHPSSVRTLSYNREPLRNQTVIRANLYVVMFMALYFIGGILLSIDTTSATTALAYSQAMITNSGISISELSVGGMIYGLGPLSKVVMMFLMLAGRLEIYPMLLLFFKSFWFKSSNK